PCGIRPVWRCWRVSSTPRRGPSGSRSCRRGISWPCTYWTCTTNSGGSTPSTGFTSSPCSRYLKAGRRDDALVDGYHLLRLAGGRPEHVALYPAPVARSLGPGSHTGAGYPVDLRHAAVPAAGALFRDRGLLRGGPAGGPD